MEQNEIDVGNILIAKFMNAIHHPKSKASEYYGGYKEWQFPDNTWYENEDLPYHISWNHIMPVVEKICKTDNKYRFDLDICIDLIEVRFYEEITQKHDTGRDFEMIANTVTVENTIQSVWLAAIDFIKHYNENNKTKP